MVCQMKWLNSWLEAAWQHYEEKKEVPIVLGVELYVYFGNWATITEIDVYHGGISVTVEDRAGNLVAIDHESLELRPRPTPAPDQTDLG